MPPSSCALQRPLMQSRRITSCRCRHFRWCILPYLCSPMCLGKRRLCHGRKVPCPTSALACPLSGQRTVSSAIVLLTQVQQVHIYWVFSVLIRLCFATRIETEAEYLEEPDLKCSLFLGRHDLPSNSVGAFQLQSSDTRFGCTPLASFMIHSLSDRHAVQIPINMHRTTRVERAEICGRRPLRMRRPMQSALV